MSRAKAPLRPLIAATLLLVFAVVVLVPGASPAATSRVLTITTESAKPTTAFRSFDANPVRVFDVDADGQKEIVTQNDNQWVYVFDSRSGAILFETRTLLPSGWGARSFNGPELAVFSNQGQTRLIVQNSAAVVTSFVFDPTTPVAGKLTFVKEWERRLDDCHTQPGSDSKPVLADLDKDGTLEILAATEENGVYALRADGEVYWKACIGGGNAEPAVGDLNEDGKPEVVFGSDGGVVSALEGTTGKSRWSYNLLDDYDLGSGSIPVGVTVAQLDGAGGPEIVLGARDSHDGSDFDNDHALLLALSGSGSVLWGKQDPEGNPLTYTRPVVVDADGDGATEVYWGDWNTIGHKPPWNEADAWKVTGPGNFYRFDAKGNQVWRTSLDSWWSNKDVPLADVDDDGVQEMLANGPDASGHDGVWYLDASTGKKETFVDLHPWKLKRAPVVADLWGTGTMQWVAQADAADSSAGGPGILVYDTEAKYDSAWPHPPVSGFDRPSSGSPTSGPTSGSRPTPGPTTPRPTTSSTTTTSPGLLPPLPIISSLTATSTSTTTTPPSSATPSPSATTSTTPTSSPPTTTVVSSEPTGTQQTTNGSASEDPASPTTSSDAAAAKDARPQARRSPSAGAASMLVILVAVVVVFNGHRSK